MYVCMYVCKCICMCLCMCLCMCGGVCICVCVYVYMQVCTYSTLSCVVAQSHDNLVEIYNRGYSSVVEHSTADREVHSSTPRVPFFCRFMILIVSSRRLSSTDDISLPTYVLAHAHA